MLLTLYVVRWICCERLRSEKSQCTSVGAHASTNQHTHIPRPTNMLTSVEGGQNRQHLCSIWQVRFFKQIIC